MRIVQRYFSEDLGIKRLAKEENMDYSLLNHWIHKYLDNGEDGLKSKGHTGNTFAAIHKSKNLTEIEKLKLTVAKQEIEIERLKKGYQAKGVGVNKEFVISNVVNSK
ncbi:MAG TPA: transposase [Lactococcus lactis]|nr:transposase [Lactococcus lactis]